MFETASVGWLVVGVMFSSIAPERDINARVDDDTPEQWTVREVDAPAERSPEDGAVLFEAMPAVGAEGAAVEPTAARGNKTTKGQRIAWTTRRWVGLKSLRRVSRTVNDDCSGLVRLAYRRHGLDVMNGPAYPGDNGVTIIWRQAKRRGALKMWTARPGDVVFFRNTHDRNGDGKRNDGLTHIGIVESVQKNGVVTFIHRSGSGVVRGRMNLRQPHTRAAKDGTVLNDYIRRPDGTKAPRLAGALFAGFASPQVYRRTGSYAAR